MPFLPYSGTFSFLISPKFLAWLSQPSSRQRSSSSGTVSCYRRITTQSTKTCFRPPYYVVSAILLDKSAFRHTYVSSHIRYTVCIICCQSFLRVVATDNSICEQSINFTLKQESKNGEGQRSAYGFRSASAGEYFITMF